MNSKDYLRNPLQGSLCKYRQRLMQRRLLLHQLPLLFLLLRRLPLPLRRRSAAFTSLRLLSSSFGALVWLSGIEGKADVRAFLGEMA